MSEYLKLDNQLCFPLYALSRQITNIYRPLLDRLGVTYPQYLVLMVLWENGTASVKKLGELLILDSGTLTPLLKRMESNGLICRTRDEKDERSVNISLSEKGQALQLEAELIPLEIKTKIKMNEEEIANLRQHLKAIMGRIGPH